MLKRALIAFVLPAGAAHADTYTAPMLQAIHECTPPGFADPQDVKLAFTVTETGAITDMHVVHSSGNADADERVMACVAQYTFKPATHNGVPVARPDDFIFHWARVADLEGDDKAFARLERDVDRRCHKLYPIDRNLYDLTQPISLVVVSRDATGEVKMAVSQSAGEKADRNAIACLKDILKDHDDLPVAFSRGVAIDWSHRR